MWDSRRIPWADDGIAGIDEEADDDDLNTPSPTVSRQLEDEAVERHADTPWFRGELLLGCAIWSGRNREARERGEAVIRFLCMNLDRQRTIRSLGHEIVTRLQNEKKKIAFVVPRGKRGISEENFPCERVHCIHCHFQHLIADETMAVQLFVRGLCF